MQLKSLQGVSVGDFLGSIEEVMNWADILIQNVDKYQSNQKKLTNINFSIVCQSFRTSTHLLWCPSLCITQIKQTYIGTFKLNQNVHIFQWSLKISLGTLLIAQMFNYTALQPSFKLEISNGTTREFHSYRILVDNPPPPPPPA